MSDELISNYEGSEIEQKVRPLQASAEGSVYLLCGENRTCRPRKGMWGSDGTLKGPYREE